MHRVLQRTLQVTSVVGTLRRRLQFFSVVALRFNMYWFTHEYPHARLGSDFRDWWL